MNWPSERDYNEAIQNLAFTSGDGELRAGAAVTNASGIPMPYSGNLADVYKVCCPATGNTWAVKCFKWEVQGLHDRYRAISHCLAQARLSFMVPFFWLDEGLRIGGRWFPIIKMRWVEGVALHKFVDQSLEQPDRLLELRGLWGKLATRLRNAGIAHADLQHGNVLLVPRRRNGDMLLRLIDYDGMYVPDLAGLHPGESGHPCYQHPRRGPERQYHADVDRFSHLAIACAISSVAVGGRALWARFHNGDNLIFRESDFKNPEASEVFQTLWSHPDPATRSLAAHLALATRLPPDRIPLLEHLIVGGKVRPLSPEEERQAGALIDPGAKYRPASSRDADGHAAASVELGELAIESDEQDDSVAASETTVNLTDEWNDDDSFYADPQADAQTSVNEAARRAEVLAAVRRLHVKQGSSRSTNTARESPSSRPPTAPMGTSTAPTGPPTAPIEAPSPSEKWSVIPAIVFTAICNAAVLIGVALLTEGGNDDKPDATVHSASDSSVPLPRSALDADDIQSQAEAARTAFQTTVVTNTLTLADAAFAAGQEAADKQDSPTASRRFEEARQLYQQALSEAPAANEVGFARQFFAETFRSVRREDLLRASPDRLHAAENDAAAAEAMVALGGRWKEAAANYLSARAALTTAVNEHRQQLLDRLADLRRAWKIESELVKARIPGTQRARLTTAESNVAAAESKIAAAESTASADDLQKTTAVYEDALVSLRDLAAAAPAATPAAAKPSFVPTTIPAAKLDPVPAASVAAPVSVGHDHGSPSAVPRIILRHPEALAGSNPRFAFAHVAMSDDGKWVAGVFLSLRQAVLYDLSNKQSPVLIPTSHRAAGAVEFSPNGRHLAITTADAHGPFIYLTTGKVAKKLETPDVIRAQLPRRDPQDDFVPPLLRFSKDGRVLLGTQKNVVVVWEMQKGMPVARFDEDSSVVSAALSPDGRTLALASRDRIVLRFAVSQDLLRWANQTRQIDLTAGAIGFSGAESASCFLGLTNEISLWNVRRLEKVRVIVDGSRWSQPIVRFASAARHAAVAHATTVSIYRLPQGNLVRTLELPASDPEFAAVTGSVRTILAVAVSGDGDRVAVATTDGAIAVW